MKLVLIRPPEPMMRRTSCTLGFLYINGQPFCFTCEDVVRAQGIKIADKTAIPQGTYQVILSYSPHFHRVLPELLDVPMFTNIRIHQGNSEISTSGCILVGDSIHMSGETPLRNSLDALTRLLIGMESAQDRKETVLIEIKGTEE